MRLSFWVCDGRGPDQAVFICSSWKDWSGYTWTLTSWNINAGEGEGRERERKRDRERERWSRGSLMNLLRAHCHVDAESLMLLPGHCLPSMNQFDICLWQPITRRHTPTQLYCAIFALKVKLSWHTRHTFVLFTSHDLQSTETILAYYIVLIVYKIGLKLFSMWFTLSLTVSAV